MKRIRSSLVVGFFALAFMAPQLWGNEALARSDFFSSRGCVDCHSAPTTATCAGCHEHSGTLTATKNKTTSYSPGETVTITLTASGARSGWIGARLYNQNGVEIARSIGNQSGMGGSTVYPAVLSAPAPATAGTYSWRIAYLGNLDGTGAGDVHGEKSVTVSLTVVSAADTTLPVVGTFTLPATATSLTVPITALSASDNVGVTGYLVNTNSTKPSATAAGWSATAPSSVTALAAGNITFYAWAKDAAGNVSAARSASVLISLDTTSYHYPAPIETLATATFSGEILADSNVRGQTRQAVSGDEIAVFDPAGVLCGRTQVTANGEFGPLTVYGDDPGTPGDEGAKAGDVLTFRFWDSQRERELPVRTLQLNGQRQTLTWSDGGGGTATLLALSQDRIGLFRNGQWRLDADGNDAMNAGDIYFPAFGIASDISIAGDWDGDGTADIGIFRNGQWRLDLDHNGVMTAADIYYPSFGMAGDIPVVGDWNNDGITDIGVYRNGQWRLDLDNNGAMNAGDIFIPAFGIAGDTPLAGDWDGDGFTDIGLYRNGQWRLDLDNNGAMNAGDIYYPSFGMAGDIPVVGDWNDDGITDIGVYRDGQWRLDLDNNGAMNAGDIFISAFGQSGDRPVSGAWR